MGLHFLRGNSQAPKGHAIFIARRSNNAQIVYSTYCLVPPIPMSIAKYLPPLFAAQIPSEELQGAANISGMPIPPMLEEGLTLQQLELLAEQRDDDLCDIGPISSEEVERMQAASLNSQEYAQLYATHINQINQAPARSNTPSSSTYSNDSEIDDLDPENAVVQAMSDRQKLAEVGKLVGMARYALEGQDTVLLQETRKRLERLGRALPEKYRGIEITRAAISPEERGAKLAELYLSRAYKLIDEEYAEIPSIESKIRELKG